MKEFNVSPKFEKAFRILKFTLGVLAIIVGISGIILPILPGWLLIFVGIELIGIKIVFIDRIKEYIKEKIRKERK